MSALPDDVITEFFKYANGVKMPDTKKFWHVRP